MKKEPPQKSTKHLQKKLYFNIHFSLSKNFISLAGGLPDWDNQGDACMKWRRFGK